MSDAPPRPSRSWTTLWYYVVVLLTFAMLSGIPFAHAATRLRGTRRLWCVVSAVAYTAVMIVAFAITPSPDEPRDTTGATIAIATVVAALVHLTFVRRWVHRAPPPPPPPAASDPAVDAVLAARRRRDEARRIVEQDPAMARELRIGRPDLPRTYDDGGLVDLNSAPAEVIAATCGVDPAVAHRLVDARAAAGTPFVRVDDAFSFSDVPFALWDRIRDRAVVVP